MADHTLCPLGLLQGAEPGAARRPLIVQARHTARPLTREERNAGFAGSWLWREPPRLPVEGVLALRIHGRYSVEYLGQPVPPPGGGGMVWPLEALGRLDRANLAPGTVVLGLGRLDRRHQGRPDCAHDEWSDSLPDLRCGQDVWLVAADMEPGSGGRESMLELQPDAHLEVSDQAPPGQPQVVPLESVFALAPRLWSGCPDAECWRWQALGMLATE